MASAPALLALALAVLPSSAISFASVAQTNEDARAMANPIRKVVTLLQRMQTQVTAEGEKEKELYEKFMCYCKTNSNTLDASIAEANNKIASTASALEEATAKKAQTEQDLKDHQASRAEAKDAMAKATALREKEASEYAKIKADSNANLAALTKAIAAIEKGAMGGFLQTSAANTLRRFIIDSADLNDGSRQELLAFLSGSQGDSYVPQSGEITGILKQIKDDMAKSLASATDDENASIQSYEGLMAAKKKEVATLTAQVEKEMTRIGELGVQIANMGNDLEDTKDTLAEDTKFVAELQAGCDTKSKQWAEISATRAEELVALAETIKVLNDDDALELFKKTLPSASSAFVQMDASEHGAKARALAVLRTLKGKPELDFIEMALKGKAMGFEKVVAMIDKMVANLKQEQTDDDGKKEYCETQLDSSEDKQKSLELSIQDSETAIEEMQGTIATLVDELAALESSIKSLDESVADATAQRKAEHEDYNTLMMDDGNAKEVLGWAKNRLNKFYSPKMYKAPPKRDLSEAEGVTVAMGGTLAPTPAPGGIANTGIGASLVQISAHNHARVAPPPPPATFDAYSKKGAEGTGVISMIDLLIKDLDKEMQESEVTEKESQREYEAMMANAASKRAEDSKAMTDKASFKAKTEESMGAETDSKAGATKELSAVLEFIGSLHAECDWLVKYYDVRKSARAGEIDALGKAKAVLNGADFSLVQTHKTGFLSA